MYFMDCLDVLLVYIVMVVVDKLVLMFLVNGNLVDKGEVDENMYFVKWYDLYLKFCYFFVLVVGDFDLFIDSYIIISGKEVVLEFYVDKGKKF